MSKVAFLGYVLTVCVGAGGFGGSTGPFGASSQPAMGQSAAGFGASPSPFGGGQSSVFGQVRICIIYCICLNVMDGVGPRTRVSLFCAF